jgi:hypothetical protein
VASIHRYGQSPLIWPIEEGLHPLVDLLAQPADLALGDTAHAHGFDQFVDRTGRDALDVGLLDHGGERLLGGAPGLEEAREVAALAQLGDAQLDHAGAGLPVAIAITVALGNAGRALLAVGRTGQSLHLDLHQALGGKADHLAQQIGVRGLLHKRAQVHHLRGHRRFPWSRVGSRNPTLTRKSSVTAARPLTRYGAIQGARSLAALLRQLHHHSGHDPLRS